MRYIPNNQEIRNEMLEEIGVDSIDDLFLSIPQDIRLRELLDISPPVSEFALLRELKELANRQLSDHISFLGAGVYRRFIPSAISPLVSRAEFLTAYTPYQPEVSQGSLQTLFEFQTLLARLTGMDIANGSMYEGATAAAEAILMASRIKPKRTRMLVSTGIHPEYLETIKTYLRNQSVEIVEIPLGKEGRTDLACLKENLDGNTLGGMIPVVNFFGVIEDQHQFRHVMDGSEALKIAVIQDMSCLGIITPPGESGFDIVVGEGQSLGLPLSYGGPNVGVFATNKKYMRQIPGRISGLTVDKNGERAFCLTLSTREQHIRREKATSNICSNQALCAFWVTIYLSLLGREGIRRLATLNLQKTHYAMKRLTGIEGVNCRFSSPVYNEFVLDLPGDSERILERLRDKGVLGGVPLSRFFNTDRRGVLVNITEVNTREEIDTFANCLKEVV